MLDGEAYQIHDTGIAGAKGFAGGRPRHPGCMGEPATKRFVQEAVDAALQLQKFPDRPPFRVLELPVPPDGSENG